MAAQVADWAEAEGRNFVSGRLRTYIEALQRFAFFRECSGRGDDTDHGLGGIDPEDVRWLIEASKASPYAVLDVLSCSYSLQFHVFMKQPDGSMGKEVFTKAVEEDTIIQLMGRRGFSEYLYRKMLAESSHRKASGTVMSPTKDTQVGPPTEAELREYHGLLLNLINLLDCQVRNRLSITLKPLAKGYTQLRAGPLFEWTVEDYHLELKPTGLLDVALVVTDPKKTEVKTVMLPKEMGGNALTGFALTREICVNCCHEVAMVVCKSGRNLCRGCLHLLRAEHPQKDLQTFIDVRTILAKFVDQAFPRAKFRMSINAPSPRGSTVRTPISSIATPYTTSCDLPRFSFAAPRDSLISARSSLTDTAFEAPRLDSTIFEASSILSDGSHSDDKGPDQSTLSRGREFANDLLMKVRLESAFRCMNGSQN